MVRITAFILSSVFAATAFAADGSATLSQQQGTVLVNQGEQFITATEFQALNVGDRVMVMEGGSAELTFADGCVLSLESGSLLEVPAVSTCAGNVASVQRIGPSYAQAVGAPRAGAADNTGAWLFFGAWAAGITYAVVRDDYSITPSPPVSP